MVEWESGFYTVVLGKDHNYIDYDDLNLWVLNASKEIVGRLILHREEDQTVELKASIDKTGLAGIRNKVIVDNPNEDYLAICANGELLFLSANDSLDGQFSLYPVHFQSSIDYYSLLHDQACIASLTKKQ